MDLVDLGSETYISLTTFKRDGTPVSTPVWVAREDGRLLVHSAAESWKVKRIRRDGHVRVTACGFNGKPRGDTFEGVATIAPETARVQELEAEKYGFVYRLVRDSTALVRMLRRKPEAEAVTIAIAPAPSEPATARPPRVVAA